MSGIANLCRTQGEILLYKTYSIFQHFNKHLLRLYFGVLGTDDTFVYFYGGLFIVSNLSR
jgi:hypothetical protein